MLILWKLHQLFFELHDITILNSDIASSQHFVDRMFNFKICVRTIFHLSRTADLGRLLKNWRCRIERDWRKSEPKGLFSNNLETIAITSCWHSFLNSVTLAFETRSAAPNFLRVVSTPNPKSILSTLIKFSFFFFKINFDESFDGLKFFDNFRFNNYFQQIFIIGLSAWYIFRYGSTLLVI